MNIVCPLCDSIHTERVVLSWAKGLSYFKANTLSIGAVVGETVGFVKNMVLTVLAAALWPLALPLLLARFLRPLFTFARIWGTNQTVLSVETAPPFYFRPWRHLLLGMALWVVVTAAYGTTMGMLNDPKIGGMKYTVTEFYWGYGAAALAVAFLIGAILTAGILYNKNIWPRRESAWQRSFLCRRCGAIFLVPHYNPIGVNAVSSRRIGKAELLPRTHTDEQRQIVQEKAFAFDGDALRKKDQSWWRRRMTKWKTS